MASTREGRQLTEAHRRRQLQISREAFRALRTVWPLLDVSNLDRSFPNYFDAAYRSLRPLKQESAEVSASYMYRFRVAEYGEGSPGLIDLERLAELSARQAATSLLVLGPVSIRKSLGKGRTRFSAERLAQAETLKGGMRLVLQGGRDYIGQTLQTDPAVRGWARVTDGDPCFFCAMLSGRGAVYTKDTVDFKPHDGCGCQPELIYNPNSYELPGKGSQFSELWAASTKGYSGRDAINAFRRAYEAQQ